MVKRLTEYAILPARTSKQAAGYDLASAYDDVVPAWSTKLIKTDLAIAVPEGHYGRIAPRSGLALHHSIDMGGGVIDCDFTGNIGVIMFNHSDNDFIIKRGDRIAQLILEKISTPPVKEVSDLTNTERGSKGFGSSGV